MTVLNDEGFDFFVAAKTARGTAIKCTKEHATYCLGVLPPIYGPGFFGMGEPFSHEEAGTTYHWIQQRGSQFWCTFGTKQEAAAAFATIGQEKK